MKKKVNGQIVEIDNIELFKEAFKGLVVSKDIVSNVSDTIEEQTGLAKDCISNYNKAYKSLPFPLYSVETNIKYAVIATYIKREVNNIEHIWVDEAIYVSLEGKKYLKMAGSNWAIVSLDKYKEDNTDIHNYKHCTGYKEFEWALERLLNNESLNGFYVKFMRDFMLACNKESMIVKWELSRLLEFGYVPEPLELKENSIIDLGNRNSYFLDIFYKGMVKTNKEVLNIRINKDGTNSKSSSSKYVKSYDFDGYAKSLYIDNEGNNKEAKNKLNKRDIDGLGSLFEQIIARGLEDDKVESIGYTGIVSNGILIYQIDNTIYKCKFNKYEKSKEIASRVNLYGFKDGKVYFYKENTCGNGVIEKTMYAYDIESEKLRMCRIEYN